MIELDSETTKLVTLARATLTRAGAPEGAAVRDLDGRTYAGAAVQLAHLELSALAVCVGMAHSSGARGLEAAVVLTDSSEFAANDLALLQDFAGAKVHLFRGTPAGQILETSTTLQVNTGP